MRLGAKRRDSDRRKKSGRRREKFSFAAVFLREKPPSKRNFENFFGADEKLAGILLNKRVERKAKINQTGIKEEMK